MVTQSVNEKWVRASAVILREQLEAIFKREIPKFPVAYIDIYQSAKQKIQHETPGAKEGWIYLKTDNGHSEINLAANALLTIASSIKNQLKQVEINPLPRH